MPSDRFQQLVKNSGDSELMKKYGVENPTSPTNSDPVNHQPQKHVDFNTYMQYDYFKNNIDLFFQDEKDESLINRIDYRDKVENIANMKYASAINDMYAKNGNKHNNATKNWTKLHNDTRELLKLLTHIQFEEGDNNQLKIANVDEDYYKTNEQINKDLKRIGELTSSWKNTWTDAELSLKYDKDDEGLYTNPRANKDILYFYDKDANNLVTPVQYTRTHSDFILNTEDYSIADMDKPMSRMKQMLTTPDPESERSVNEFMTKWFSNSINSIANDKVENFNSATEHSRNQDFVDMLFRDLIKLGVASGGIGNYTPEKLNKLKKNYDKSIGAGTKEDPHDYRNKIKYLQNNTKLLHDLTQNLNPMQMMDLFESYEFRGGNSLGKYTNPGKKNKFTTQGTKESREEYDRFKNDTYNYLNKTYNLRNTHKELLLQTSKDSKWKQYLIDEANTVSTVYSPDQATEELRTAKVGLRPWFKGVNKNFGDNRTASILLYNLGQKATGDLLTFDEAWRLDSALNRVYNVGQATNQDYKRVQDAKDNFIAKKIQAYNDVITQTNEWLSLDNAERKELLDGWNTEFDELGSMTNGNTIHRNHYYKYENKFSDIYNELNPAIRFVNAGVVGGHKMKGNYSQSFKGVSFKESTNPKENLKNVNSNKMFDGLLAALDADLEGISDAKNMYYTKQPNIVAVNGDFKYGLNPGNYDDVNDLVTGNKDYEEIFAGPGTFPYVGDENIMPLNESIKDLINKISTNQDGNYYEVKYHNAAGNSKYKAYTIYKENEDGTSDKSSAITFYVKKDYMTKAGEGFASAEYNDSADYNFDLTGEHSVSRFSNLAGVNMSDGTLRITEPTIVSKNGIKYLRYIENNELDPATDQGMLYFYLGDMNLSIDKAEEQIKRIFMNYNNVHNDRSKTGADDLNTIISRNVL